MLILTIFLRIHHSFFFPIAFLSHCDKLLIIIRDLSKKRLTISTALTRLNISEKNHEFHFILCCSLLHINWRAASFVNIWKLTLLSTGSVQFSRSVVSDSLQPHEPQHARPPCPSPTPGVHPSPCPLCWWCHPTISFCHHLLFLPSIFPSIKVFQWVSSSHQVAKLLEFQLQHQSFQWTPRTDLL